MICKLAEGSPTTLWPNIIPWLQLSILFTILDKILLLYKVEVEMNKLCLGSHFYALELQNGPENEIVHFIWLEFWYHKFFFIRMSARSINYSSCHFSVYRYMSASDFQSPIRQNQAVCFTTLLSWCSKTWTFFLNVKKSGKYDLMI